MVDMKKNMTYTERVRFGELQVRENGDCISFRRREHYISSFPPLRLTSFNLVLKREPTHCQSDIIHINVRALIHDHLVRIGTGDKLVF